MRVIAAMSGGVDSSVAAARLVDAGHEVVGVHLALARSKSAGRGRGCCTLDDARDARRVADMLGIPFYVWDLSEQFASAVIDDFLAEYSIGRTPNPCVRCNQAIKFRAVLDRAIAMDFDAIATGHYARIVRTASGSELHRAADPDKDQSYVLAVMAPDALERTLLPLGADVKDTVRQEAEARGLLVARKPDSHDICFIPDGDTAGFVSRRLGSSPGVMIDADTGDVVGEHAGTHAFTIGQRRGLGIAGGPPRYVVDVDATSRIVTVGPPTLLDIDRIEAIDPVWHGARPEHVQVQVRAHGAPVPGRVGGSHERPVIDLLEPIRGLAPGQCVVMYDGTRVVGAATVDRTRRLASA
jgi:tRNA-specific 2-thiouridylase